MKEEHWRDREADQHLEEVSAAVRSHDGFVAVGLDMAADENNWGFAVLLVAADLQRARLALLLPRLATRTGGDAAARIRLMPSARRLRSILTAVQQGGLRGSLAVDVPFGWPVEHAEFTTGWRATSGLTGSSLPPRAQFELRLCDRAFRDTFRGLRVFPVGGDSIAQAAFAWAIQVHAFQHLVGAIDVGLNEAANPFVTFETYPAAFVRNVCPACADYTSLPAQRRALLRNLCASGYRFSVRDDGKDPTEHAWCSWAISQNGSPNALDALLCAFTAWDHLRWRYGAECPRLSLPETILGRALQGSEPERIRREGWILVRMPVGAEATVWGTSTP